MLINEEFVFLIDFLLLFQGIIIVYIVIPDLFVFNNNLEINPSLKVSCEVDSSFTSYRSGTVNLKSFVGKDFLQIKWKYELTMHFKHGMIGK